MVVQKLSCCSRSRLPLALWLLMFLITFGLVIIALATSDWMVWTNNLNYSRTERGLFYSRDDVLQSCFLSDLIRRTQDDRYSQFSVNSVAGLLIAAAVVDVIAVGFGLFYFYIKQRDKQKLWRYYIPTTIAALTAAAFVLIGCLVFVMDMSEVIETTIPVTRYLACSTDVKGAHVMVEYYWSFYLALISGGLSCIKGLLFTLLAWRC
ncbi:uncharacterized protein LOC106064336 isoform X1 [Biomphalaria glabrata]|uniref:Uncharacterized protein LOC106064336 isoform X1 n=2 Tax=Biomphalaria glabrata TaxID=6526 RepID=A0A9W3ACI9_BIOGL|nr:uncharacterized protein LOC106064336 isoform X1 [Biomphalaria glabrata]